MELAHADLSRRLEGFPQQYATKVEAEAAASAVQRLEKDALPREIYEQRHRLLVDQVNKVDREKLAESVYISFLEDYHRDQTRASEERREVAAVLATATERVRAQVVEERSDFITQEYYDTAHTSVVQQVNAVERWQYKMVGGLVFATFVAPLITGFIVYIFTKGLI